MLIHGFINRVAALGMAMSLVVAGTAVTRGQATGTPATTTTTKAKAKAKAKALLDVNKATAEELEATLPGVGPATAKKIIAGRPYSKVEDLAKAGVSAKVVDEIKNLVTIGKPAAAVTPTAAKSRVDLNKAPLAELEALPGIGPAHAKAIVDGRPYKSVDDLEKVTGLGKTRIDALRPLVTTAGSASATVPAETPATKTATKAAAKKAASSATTKPSPTKPVNINTAILEELDSLFGIGPVRAQAIIDGRPYKAIEDVMKVKGIKEGEFAKIKDFITVK